MPNHNPQTIRQRELAYDNHRKALFLWLADITPSSQVNEHLKDCTTDEVMHFFDMGYRHACTQIQQAIKMHGAGPQQADRLLHTLDELILASFSLGRQGHTDRDKNLWRKVRFEEFSANNPLAS